MFLSPHLPLIIQRANLKVDKNKDGERIRVAHLSLVMEPFTYEVARELDDTMVEHWFTPDRRIRRELEDVTLNPGADLQCITVASAADAPVLATIRNASILDLQVKHCRDEDAEWLKAVLTVRIDLGERKVREFLFHHFGELRLFSFAPEQEELPMDDLSSARAAKKNLDRIAAEDGGTARITTADGTVLLEFGKDGKVTH